MKKQAGFTLIELIMVIVILGILAAVALPRFVNLAGDARAAALNGVAGAIASADAVNVAVANLPGRGTTTTGVACNAAVASLMQGGAVPAGYTVSALPVLLAGANNCTLTQTDGLATATVNVTGVTAL